MPRFVPRPMPCPMPGFMSRLVIAPAAVLSLAAVVLAACAPPQVAQAPAPVATPHSLNASFAEDSRGTIIPDAKPDPDAVAAAQRCAGHAGSPVRMGMTECDLIGGKGTPSRMVAGLDQQGGSHDAVWYIEGGARTVYKFDDDKLIDVIH